MFLVPQSTSLLVVFKAYLSTDHVTEATGKTIAITISKNGGAFGNPNAGATNATEISSGWYKVTLDTTDTATLGPLAIRGAVATVDDIGILYRVVKATNAGWTALPDAAADAAGGLIISDAGGLDADAQRADVAAILVDTGTTLDARIPAALVSGRMDASVGAMAANVMTAAAAAADLTTELQSGLATAAALATVDTVVDAIQAKTDNLPSDPADQSIVIAATDALATLIGDVPTNAELATALGTADDAVLAAVAVVDTVVDAIKLKTDSLTFTVAGQVDSNIQYVNDTQVTGDGETGTEWGPA